jgi:hypothetical protein
MADDTLSFEEYRRRFKHDPSRVRCARCGKWIAVTATRCPECGVYFRGEAFEFTHASERASEDRWSHSWMVLVALVLLLVLILITVGLW